MSELRAPDPTLTALGDEYVMLQPHPEDGRYPLEVAHRSPDQIDRARCGWTFPGIETWLPAWNAAWFAVPCRACFPDAPPPGHEWRQYETHGDGRVAKPGAHPDLAWQTGGGS